MWLPTPALARTGEVLTKGRAARLYSSSAISLRRKVQQANGIFVINLFQNRLGQLNAIDFPAALRRNLGWSVIEILIIGFKETIVDLVQLVVEDLLRKLIAMERRVCAEKNAVLIFVEEAACTPWLPPKFADPGGNINAHVWKAVEVLGDISKIFGEVANVKHKELGFRMTRENTIAGLKQLCISGKVVIVERPVGVIVQLFVTLIEAVSWREKCNRIGDVNCHGYIQLGTGLPHRVKTTIVNFH